MSKNKTKPSRLDKLEAENKALKYRVATLESALRDCMRLNESEICNLQRKADWMAEAWEGTRKP